MSPGVPYLVLRLQAGESDSQEHLALRLAEQPDAVVHNHRESEQQRCCWTISE